jgi:hypothetical protein
VRLEFLNFISRWGDPIEPIRVSDSYFDEYRDQLPELMLDLWREVGFAGFGDGLLWICDPHHWQPIVDAWLDGTDLPTEYRGNQIPLFRTAYGKIYCFKPGLGQKVEIDPILSNIALFRPETLAGQEWIDMGISDVLGFPPTQFLVHADYPTEGDDLQEDLFALIADRLGRTSHSTIYAFQPSIQEGGNLRAEYAVLSEATAELVRLRALQSPEISID